MFRNFDIYTQFEITTLRLAPPREFLLGNWSYCNETSSTKISMFSKADDFFPLSQYINPYSKKTWTCEEIFSYYRLSRKIFVTENVFGI